MSDLALAPLHLNAVMGLALSINGMINYNYRETSRHDEFEEFSFWAIGIGLALYIGGVLYTRTEAGMFEFKGAVPASIFGLIYSGVAIMVFTRVKKKDERWTNVVFAWTFLSGLLLVLFAESYKSQVRRLEPGEGGGDYGGGGYY